MTGLGLSELPDRQALALKHSGPSDATAAKLSSCLFPCPSPTLPPGPPNAVRLGRTSALRSRLQLPQSSPTSTSAELLRHGRHARDRRMQKWFSAFDDAIIQRQWRANPSRGGGGVSFTKEVDTNVATGAPPRRQRVPGRACPWREPIRGRRGARPGGGDAGICVATAPPSTDGPEG